MKEVSKEERLELVAQLLMRLDLVHEPIDGGDVAAMIELWETHDDSAGFDE